ncbi:hypothetical protein [Pseudarthrobacter sp. NS4]|uniref:hypothetical protein n=1 Tax=Pseudarthrobacter sp. NS4 TaxID=2973976 RepID=UPI002163B530|nr:hypothetical protein [Pseudarthrobacter sp. NS4]
MMEYLTGLLAIAALLVALALLVTLVTLEVQRVGPDAEEPTRRLLGRTVTRRVVAVMWLMCLFLVLPRVLELLA